TVANAHKLCSALAAQASRLDPSRIVNLTNAVYTDDELAANPARSFFWTRAGATHIQDSLDWRPDVHHYHGWYTGEAGDVRELPDGELELVTEFGAQGLPSAASLRALIPDADLWPPPWSALA